MKERIVGYILDGKMCCRDCLPAHPAGDGEPILSSEDGWKATACITCLRTFGDVEEGDWINVSDDLLLDVFSIILPSLSSVLRTEGEVGVSLDFLYALLREVETHDVDSFDRNVIERLRHLLEEHNR